MKDNKKLSAKNAAFWALDKRNRRIAIAKDVIKQIDAGKISASSGTYFKMMQAPKSDGKLDLALKEQSHCSCCGLGACFYSLIMLGDKVKVSEVIEKFPYLESFNYGHSVYSDKMRDYLRDHFSSEQITLIESAFEKHRIEDPLVKKSKELTKIIRKAVSFGEKADKNFDISGFNNVNENRLISIMKNIIKNRGTFRLDKP